MGWQIDLPEEVPESRCDTHPTNLAPFWVLAGLWYMYQNTASPGDQHLRELMDELDPRWDDEGPDGEYWAPIAFARDQCEGDPEPREMPSDFFARLELQAAQTE